MKIRKLFLILVFSSLSSYAQFTLIPTGTDINLMDIEQHGDTLLISGRQNYFAKYYINEETIESWPTPGNVDFYNTELQVIDDTYYLFSQQGPPYEENYILKSIDYGHSWSEIFANEGLFYSLTISPNRFGVLSGSFGSHALADDVDEGWDMQDSLYSVMTASDVYGDSTLLLAGMGVYYLSNNRGRTWDWIPYTNFEVYKVSFFNEDIVYAISNEGRTPFMQPSFQKSNTGGTSWTRNYIGVTPGTLEREYYAQVIDFHFFDEYNGYLLGYVYRTTSLMGSQTIKRLTLFKTADAGDSWTPYVTEIDEEPNDFVFVNDSLAYIIGDNGLLLKWDLNVPLNDVLSVNETEISTNDIRIYPNPSTNKICIESEFTTVSSASIYDLKGDLIREVIINSNCINTENIPNGIYILSLKSSQEVYNFQFVKE